MIQQTALLDRRPQPMGSDVPLPSPAPEHARRIEELGRIILAYSEVTDKLQRSHEQLTQTVQSLREEISEKNRQLERKTRLAALGEMAASMAHEIRNPLGGINLYASLLAKDVSDRPASLEVVRKISGGVKRLEALVSQVLQFAREISLNVAPMDLSQTVAQSIDFAADAIVRRQIHLDVDGPPTLMVNADALLIGQVILNLLLNAAEAMETGGTLTIRFGAPAEPPARQFFISVSDTGPGISPQAMDRLFDPFFTTKATGTGLGLPIVQRIIEAHDGTIIAANQSGGGARFEIRV